MLQFILGTMFGAFMGIAIHCIIIVGKEADNKLL